MAKISFLKSKNLTLPAVDQYVVLVVMGLSAIGVVAVYSAITFLAETRLGGDTEEFLLRHLLRLSLGLVFMAVFSKIDYHRLAGWSRYALIVSLVLLVLVQLVGVASGGAERWIGLGFFMFQPSDLAKVSLILYVAFLLTKKQEYIDSLNRAFIPVMLWIFLTVLLIGMENLSTASIILVSTCLMCFVGRVRIFHLSGLVAVCMVLAYLFLLTSPGRAARVESYVGAKIFPNTDSTQVFDDQDEGYQAQQAKIAFAMGGLTGVGPGKSVQRDFLPAPYNDFIFAIIAEEYGILGALALLGTLVILLFRGFVRIARNAPDPLGLFLAVGLTTIVVMYGFIHAGVACGLLPVTGLPMPFVSYGGTSLVATGVMVGVLLNISGQANAALAASEQNVESQA